MTRYLLELTAAELRRSQSHNLLLLKGAQERVVGFLRRNGCSADSIRASSICS